MMSPRLIAICVLLGMLLGACAGDEPAPAPQTATPSPDLPSAMLVEPGEPGSLQPTRCGFILPPDLHEGTDVECAYLSVAEQRESVNAASPGRAIQLAVAIFHPPGGATVSDPVIFLSGGPGASALEPMRYQFDILSEPVFATGRDLVVFDQRGVGLSRPALDCPGYDALSLEMIDRQIDGRSISEEEAAGLVLDRLRACRAELSGIADLSAYHSAASAADVEDLRLALGYDHINLWGGSYGTRLALEVMRRYPDGLRSVVLDAVYPPDVDLYVEAPANFQRALDRLFDACASNQVCAQAHPNLRQTYFSMIDRLNAEPVLLESEDPFTGDLRQTWINGNTILALTFQLLYDSRLRYLLPQQFEAASQGDYRAFELAIAALSQSVGLSSRGMMLSVQCHEELAFSSLDAIQAEVEKHPEVRGIYASSLLGELTYRICEEWGARKAEPSANEPVASDVPALLMTGEFDPITPPAWGQHAAETLSRGHVFEYAGVGHGASALPGCPRQMLVAFLTDPLSAPEDTCIADMQ